MTVAGPRPTHLLRGGRGSDDVPVDIRIGDGVIVETGALVARGDEPVTDLGGRLVLPAFADPHVHLDKAFTGGRATNRGGDLAGAMDSYAAVAASGSPADIYSRARHALRLLVAAGATAVRCQTGCGPLSGVAAVEALARLRSEVGAYVDVQIVAHAAVPPGGPHEHRALLVRALDAGADHLGGNPFLEEEPQRAFETCLDVAADRGCELDLHVDESPTSLTLPYVIAGARDSGVRVVAAHCVSLGGLPEPHSRQIAAEAAEAGVAVVTLPMTNLYLQGRTAAADSPRGLTAITALRTAGVTVAAGTDNIQDPFNPVGRCDPLEIASLLVTAGHQPVDVAVAMIGPEARRVLGLPVGGLTVGAPADLVALPAHSLGDMVARAPVDRLVWRRGELVARTATTVDAPF